VVGSGTPGASLVPNAISPICNASVAPWLELTFLGLALDGVPGALGKLEVSEGGAVGAFPAGLT